MDMRLIVALGATAGAALGTALLLVVIKLTHREIQRWRGVRTAHYIAAVGEMVSRGMLPSDPPRTWAHDPYFHNALSDYRLLLTGADQRFIDSLVDRLGIHEVLGDRIARWLPVSSRLRALSTLIDLADQRHLPALRALLADRNDHIRLHAARGLARLGDVGSVELLLGLARAARPWEAARLADSLVEMGFAATAAIRQWIEAETANPRGSVDVVTLATRVLGLIGDPEAEPTLVTLLRSNQPDWRVAAASALEHTGGDDAIKPLLTALTDHSWRVRARAVTALGGLAHPDVAEEMATLLSDEVWWVRQNAATALEGVPGGIDRLLAALDGPDPYAADAALNQLTTSGYLAAAIARAENGEGSVEDRRLLVKAGRPPAPVETPV